MNRPLRPPSQTARQPKNSTEKAGDETSADSPAAKPPETELAKAESFEELDAPPKNARRARYSPSGQHVVFHAGDENAGDIFLLEVATKKLTKPTDDKADDRDPTFAPDGQRVVFASNRAEGGDYALYVLTLAESSTQIQAGRSTQTLAVEISGLPSGVMINTG